MVRKLNSPREAGEAPRREEGGDGLLKEVNELAEPVCRRRYHQTQPSTPTIESRAKSESEVFCEAAVAVDEALESTDELLELLVLDDEVEELLCVLLEGDDEDDELDGVEELDDEVLLLGELLDEDIDGVLLLELCELLEIGLEVDEDAVEDDDSDDDDDEEEEEELLLTLDSLPKRIDTE